MKRLILIAAASALVLAGCAQNPYTGEHSSTATGATVGAGAGALLGNVIAGSGNKTGGTLIGAAVGATVGGLIGRQMDEQERQLRQEMEGTGVDVQRQGDTIRLQAPESITFDTNSADIKPQFQEPLARIAESIRQ
ncbi:glycine zipper domain-containing protein, partial [Guyparkeria sp.]|uniref:glycine zipper domain-containing protein n=1 Tax=Guyparkeria sp. TaxID=2035736 RepID=UPI00397076BC